MAVLAVVAFQARPLARAVHAVTSVAGPKVLAQVRRCALLLARLCPAQSVLDVEAFEFHGIHRDCRQVAAALAGVRRVYVVGVLQKSEMKLEGWMKRAWWRRVPWHD